MRTVESDMCDDAKKYDPEKRYPVVDWRVDGKTVKREVVSIGHENPQETTWIFKMSAGDPPYAIMGNSFECVVSFAKGEELNLGTWYQFDDANR